MRLIDADALMFRLEKRNNIATDLAFAEGLSAAMVEVEDSPTLSPDDVRGVGEWEVLDRVADMDVFRCSACRSIIHCETVLGKSNFAYCPICGAKMEGTSDGI